MPQEQWKPPDFAKPSTGAWKPPDFAKPKVTAEPEESKSLIGKGLDWAFTTPKPVKEAYAKAKGKYEEYAEPLQKQYGENALDFAASGAIPQPPSTGIDLMESMSTPGDVAMMAGTGGMGNIARATRGLSKVASGALAARGGLRALNAEDWKELAAGLLETGMGALGYKFPVTWGAGEKAAAKIPEIDMGPKRLTAGVYEVTPEGVARGGKQVPSLREQVAGNAGREATIAARAPEAEVPLKEPTATTKPRAVPKLPKDLAGAQPKFNIGYNSYAPEFESDLDKALYIIAQTKRSRRDDDYLKYAMEATGLDEIKARKLGTTVRAKIKSTVAGQEPGKVKIGQIHKLTPDIVVKPKMVIPEDVMSAAPIRETPIENLAAPAAKLTRSYNANEITPPFQDIVTPPKDIPIVTKVQTPEDYALDIAYMKARGQEVPPELAALAKAPITSGEVPDFVKAAKEKFKIARGESPITKTSQSGIPEFETKPQSFFERLVSEEEGTYRPGFIGRAFKKRQEELATNKIRDEVVDTLVRGGRLDLNSIYEHAAKSGITRPKFNKIIDTIRTSGEVQRAAQEKAAKVKNPVAAAVNDLYSAIGAAKAGREEQEAIYSAERSKRFSDFMKVKQTGEKGARRSLAKLKGAHTRVNVPGVELPKEQVDALFTSVKLAQNITPGEKAHGYEALFKLLDGGHVPQRGELAILDKVFGAGFSGHIIELHGGLGVAGLRLAKTANTMKAMMASVDLSAPLRQGLPLIHRTEFWGAARDMFGYAASSNKFETMMKALEERPKYLLGREGGLHLSDTGSLLTGEEAYLNSYLHDLGDVATKLKGSDEIAARAAGSVISGALTPFKASERAYVGFLNKLRADTFDNMIDAAVALGHNPEKVAPGIARFINSATGRGSLGRLEKMAPELNTVLFSPRLIASRVGMLTNPKLYKDLPVGMRKEGIKSLFAVAGGGMLFSSLVADRFGGKVSDNPLSTDFGKARIGNNVIDPYGGFQQYIVAATRFMLGKTDSPATGAFAPTRYSIAENFAANKLSPAASLAYEIARSRVDDKTGERENRFGQPLDIEREVRESFIPLFVQDLQELYEDDPDFRKVIGFGTPALFGMGTQTYPERTERRANRGPRRPTFSVR